MKGEHFRLNGHSRLPVTEELRDQRQIEPLARPGRAGGKLRNQFVPQRAKIGALERHRRQSGESDAVGARVARKTGRRAALRLHGNLRQFRAVRTSEQLLELRNRGADIIKRALQIPARRIFVG